MNYKYITDIKPNRNTNIKTLKQLNLNKNNYTFEEILDYIVANVRTQLEKKLNINIDTDPLTNKCDLVQAILGYIFKELGIKVQALDIQKCLNSSVCGHSFLVVSFDSENKYLVDLTYRQFFLKEDCEDTKYLISNGLILLAPLPGNYYLHNKSDIKIADKIIKDGYIKLDEKSAKIYGDSFYVTHRGLVDDVYQNKKSNISGKIYMNSFLKTNCNYSKKISDLETLGFKIL